MRGRPFLTVIVLAAAAAAAVAAGFFLIVVPAVNGLSRAPADLGHAYVAYFDGVGQELHQAQQAGGAP